MWNIYSKDFQLSLHTGNIWEELAVVAPLEAQVLEASWFSPDHCFLWSVWSVEASCLQCGRSEWGIDGSGAWVVTVTEEWSGQGMIGMTSNCPGSFGTLQYHWTVMWVKSLFIMIRAQSLIQFHNKTSYLLGETLLVLDLARLFLHYKEAQTSVDEQKRHLFFIMRQREIQTFGDPIAWSSFATTLNAPALKWQTLLLYRFHCLGQVSCHL